MIFTSSSYKKINAYKELLKVFASLSIMRDAVIIAREAACSTLQAVRGLQHQSCRGGLQASSDH